MINPNQLQSNTKASPPEIWPCQNSWTITCSNIVFAG
jgi:hypothetical protein